MKKFFVILAFGLLASCATKVTSPAIIPTPPPITVSAKPSIEKTQKGIDESVTEVAKSQEKISEQKQSITKQDIALADAVVQAERIREKAAAKEIVSEIEAVNLLTILDEAQKENSTIRKKNEELEVTNANMKSLLENAQVNNRDSLVKVIDKENEAGILRDQNKDVGQSLTQKNKEVQDLFKDKVKDAKKIGSSGVYKHFVLGAIALILVGGIFAWLVKTGIIFAKSQNPLSK